MSKLKTLLFVFAALAATASFQSCDSDACSDLVIPEGCTCEEGVISCDPCDNVTCPLGYSCDNGNCISDDGLSVIKTGVLTADETWTKDKVWILNGKVVVDEGITLTIEAGTIIKGQQGEGSLASALIVARGGTLDACATASEPIIMTSILDDIEIGQTAGSNLDENDAGKWGGLIVLGYAPISVDGDAETARIEGIPASETYGIYGGTDPADNSGCISYVSVRHGGALLGEGNEINGITFGGVGSGTTVDHIEVVGNLDDGIECFGGTVNISNAVVWAQGDDAYDMDQAYSGTIDNFVYIAGDESDHGMEIDGPEGSADGQFTMTNGTMKGLSAEYADFRDGAQANISNVYWFNFDATDDGDEFELDDDVSSANYHTNNLLILTGMEFNTLLAFDKLFDDKAANGDDAGFETKMNADNTVGDGITPSVGANTSVFGWTLTSIKGALNF
jgi:hypothetical protein